MFSVEQKRHIANEVQRILRETGHPELPEGEISFHLHVDGETEWSYADIRNNGAVTNPGINEWNEKVPTMPKEEFDECKKVLNFFTALDNLAHEPEDSEE